MMGVVERFNAILGDEAFDEFDLRMIEEPNWDAMGRVQDWRQYVPETVKELWDVLGLEARLAVYLTALKVAALEEWD